MSRRLLATTSLWLAVLSPASGEDKNGFHANIVLFVQEGQDVPKGYEARLQSLGLRAEAFFAKWMKHWGSPVERPQIFARGEGDKIKVTLVGGKVFNPGGGRAALPGIRQKAIESAGKQLSHNPRKPATWWIFYHAEGVKGFQGAGGPNGGVAINAYPDGKGIIPLDAELSSPELDAHAIKGTVHEFGHALGLPHIGPRPANKLGNSLMGPINRAYWRRVPGKDARVHLNEASAAMLKSHPIFRKAPPAGRPEISSEVAVSDLKATVGKDGKSIAVSGSLKSPAAAHSVLIVDSERNKFGDYWARAYTAKLNEKGAFEVYISEPFERGTLFVGFSFNNGTNTGGDGKSFQGGSGVTITYQKADDGFDFESSTE